MQIVGAVLIFLGIAFIYIGIFGMFRFKNFYARILSSSDVDTMGMITMLTGVIILKSGSWFSMKVLLILCILLIVNPIVTSSITSSAYSSGHRLKEEGEND